MARKHLFAIPFLFAATAATAGCTSSSDALEAANAEADATDVPTASACPFEADESVTGTVRVAFQVLPSGDLIVKDHGILEACLPNADIAWTQYASGGDVVQAFGSDSVDIGTVGSSPTVKALSAPLDLDVQVVYVQDVIGDAEALVVKDAAIASTADLAGTTIAVPFGSTAHFSVLAAVTDAGLDPATDLTIINLAPDAILGAWKGDEIDAAYIWDPTLSEILADGTQLLSSTQAAEIGAPTFDLSVASTAFIEANPAFMEAWTKAQDWAVQLIQDSPAQAAEAIAIQMGSDAAVVEGQLAGTGYLTAAELLDGYFGGDLAPVLSDTAAFLAEQGEIDAAADDEHYAGAVYTGALESIGG
ncbi:taurine ABC transporter substrate-binding protein [Demequina pelophila]|uniref:taurine ABC transporter substrate-binding protein n=1 Tax=Demequina pelophila TaxID=1638984 RepID=UPI0007802F3C|nr:ABC transporter substrate-binding protein [Demequina pelophila]